MANLAGDVVIATIELGLARFRLNSHLVDTLQNVMSFDLTSQQTGLINRVAYIIPRVAARLPWRANCLVQALAAQRWLRRKGVETRMTLGVPKDKPSQFEAHAWLTAGTRIVTGGDISGYVPLRRP